MHRTFIAGAAAAFILGSASAAFADAFTDAVEKVLIQDKRIADLNAAKRAQMYACVEAVLANVPKPTKRAIAEAPSFDEMQDRFGKLVLANRAKLEQAITKRCGNIVVNP